MKDLVEIALQAGIEASEKILEIYHTDFDVYKKSDHSPVTDADLASTNILETQLAQFDIPIISEEKEIPLYEDRKKFDQYFLIDPLDGTKEFIGKTGEFCINIALVVKETPVLGFIFNPTEKEVLIGGSYTNEVVRYEFHSNGKFHHVQTLSPTSTNNKKDVVRLICSRRADFERLKFSAMDRFQTEKIEIITKGSALKFIDLAMDRADYYLRFGKTMEWDIAPGFAILKQLSGSIDHLDYNKPLSFNKENLLNPPFIAYNNK
ncbi:MAG: 3'(2'),5'-bisphosphate nucleotidase CysQ [Crocinitomicaceae bacterium]|nr:3'(2'),5'-bisphosphate nucleotidase CysQ [Crocinitomicaceae bacterium]